MYNRTYEIQISDCDLKNQTSTELKRSNKDVCTRMGLSINVEKAKCMIFVMGYELGQCPYLKVKINGSKINQVDKKDYLGLT